MAVTWLLFLLWLISNALDVEISLLAIQLGATEVGLLYQISGSWITIKAILALVIGGLLVYARKDKWLALLTLGMSGLCLYNGLVLLWQMQG